MIYFANPVKAAVGIMSSRGDFGMIVTPRQGNRLPADVLWVADNGCGPSKSGEMMAGKIKTGAGYPGDEGFLRYLASHADRASLCLFATAPDVVGDAAATLARSAPMLPRIRALGYPGRVGRAGRPGGAEDPVGHVRRALHRWQH
jgi:hypothetical protein